MFTVIFNFDSLAFPKNIYEIIQRTANERLNAKITPLIDDIKKEPQGRFVGTYIGDTLSIKPKGFSEQLTHKLIKVINS